MKKVGLVGLYSIDNMGDCLLCETTRYILEDAVNDIKIREIDAAPRGLSSYPGLHKLNLLFSALLIRTTQVLFSRTAPASKARYRIERFAWRLKLQWYFKKRVPTCDAIIFAGGGFLKYRTQGLNYIVEQIIELCERQDRAVMLSAVGIEGYDAQDYRCRRLKDAIASPSVHAITTRDYLEILQDKYDIAPPVRTRLVGDPAYWAPECYGIRKQENTNKIGINLIREDIFQRYGNRLSAEELKRFYVNVIGTLDANGADWVLFSNGMNADEEFGRTLLKELGKQSDLMLPPPRTARDLVAMISGYRCILGARMHACISAYALDIPVVGLIWNEKLSRFAEITQQRAMFFDESELNARTISEKLLTATRSSYDDAVRENLKKRTQDEIAAFLRVLDSD